VATTSPDHIGDATISRPAPAAVIPKERRMGRAMRLVSASLVVATLLPTLLWPLGIDVGLFFVSGQKLLAGAVYYRDIVDLKPPLIYYMYAVAIALFGNGAVAIRIFDLILQVATCWLIFSFVRRYSRDELWGALSALLYALLYVVLSPNSTAQPEAYLGLAAIPMILLLERGGAVRSAAAGALAGVLFLLKFPLAMMLVVAGAIILFDPPADAGRRWRLVAALGAGFLAVVALLPIYLVVFDVVHEFTLLNQYTRGYVAVSHLSTMEYLRMTIESLTEYFGEYFSMTLSILVAAGIIEGLRRRTTLSSDSARLVRYCALSVLALILSVAVEGKYVPYRFSRMYPFVAILGALGILIALGLLRRRDAGASYRGVVIAGVAAFVVLFSPIARYAKHSYAGVMLATRGTAAFDALYDRAGLLFTRAELEQIADTVDSRRAPGDRMLVLSSAAGLVYHYAHELPPFKIYHSAFLIPSWAPQEWKDSLRSFVLDGHAPFILIQRSDSLPSLTGEGTSIEQAFRAMPGIDSLMHASYMQILRTRWYDLYQRKGGENQ
jgi:hypothetical protein